MSAEDPYVYSGTDVLRNKAGIRDTAQLERYERLKTRNRQLDISLDIPITVDGYKSIHRRLFQDVYEWAGEFRTVNVAKGDLFCLAPYIESEIKSRFDEIRREDCMRNLSREKFAARAADHMTEINAIHPFREGNGRTQRLFLKSLARQAGHEIDLSRIDGDSWMAASIKGHRGDMKPMEAIIGSAMEEREKRPNALNRAMEKAKESRKNHDAERKDGRER